MESVIVGATSEKIRPLCKRVVRDFVVSKDLKSIFSDECLLCLYLYLIYIYNYTNAALNFQNGLVFGFSPGSRSSHLPLTVCLSCDTRNCPSTRLFLVVRVIPR